LLDELLFENRNKSYGAYTLRQESDRILTKSMFIGVAFFATVAAIPFVVASLNTQDKKIAIPNSDKHILTEVNIADVVEPVKPIVVPPKEEVRTFNSVVPTPTKNPVVEQPVAKISDFENAVAGFENKDGVAPIHTIALPNTPVAMPTEILPEKTISVPDNTPKTVVDIEAAFAGGIDNFRNRVLSNFDASGFEGAGEVLKTTITFVVEKDGTISNIIANGSDKNFNREAEKTIKSVKGKWVPAKLDGQPVRSYFKFPISMRFE
ncbi:MAG: energy transducer TonB, partial [Cruoricaptor ignavus]|nr:energy transducer TonB [Cruoricaptor ignavus]